VFGSGWCWLELCGSRAAVTWQPNQATPAQRNCTPLLGIDVWGEIALTQLFVLSLLFTSAAEHAYYLKHANKRAPYIANMLLIINVRFLAASASHVM
jgi:superoxide dismutase